jgi:hypothetical protein
MKITRVDEYKDFVQRDIARLAEQLQQRDAEQRKLQSSMLHHYLWSAMSNKVKSTIAIVLAAISQLLKLWGVVEIPQFILDALTVVLTFLAGLLLPAPKDKQ